MSKADVNTIEKLNIEALNMAQKIVDKSEIKNKSDGTVITVYNNIMVMFRQAHHDKTMSGALNSTVASTLKKFGLGG
jgi:regulator of RNase E activity RraB